MLSCELRLLQTAAMNKRLIMPLRTIGLAALLGAASLVLPP